MCCKALPIAALEKPAQSRRTHCDIGKGCRIYADRPDDCRTFYCGWMLDANFGDHWRPSDSRMVIMFRQQQLVVAVDKAQSQDWRREPFISHLRAGAKRRVGRGGDVFVTDGANSRRILPDDEPKLS